MTTTAMLAFLSLSPAHAPWEATTTAPWEAHPALTYRDACSLAMALSKPVVVWVGGNFCERCVSDTRNEFVHHFTATFEGAVAPAIVVGVPDGNGLTRIATITSWVEGDATHGHVPSIRRAIRNWRASRQRAVQSPWAMRYEPPPSVFVPRFFPSGFGSRISAAACSS